MAPFFDSINEPRYEAWYAKEYQAYDTNCYQHN